MSVPESRYRRRVLTAGGLVAFALFVVGAPIYNNRIEADLERRVPAALVGSGHAGVTVRFSGQDGRITCVSPLADPEGAIDLAYDVRGVNSIVLDRSCRVATAPDGTPLEPSGTLPGSSPAPATLPATGASSVPTSAPTSALTFPTVQAAIDGDGLFSSLAVLTAESELAAQLADPRGGPYTVFAPTDLAFGALPSETESLLAADATVREATLRGLVVEGEYTADDLAALAGSTLTTLAGTELEVVAGDDGAISVGGAGLAGVPPVPLVSARGLVYAVDRVLLPDGVAGAPTGAAFAATLDRGAVTLTGTVATRADADRLVDAATAAVGAGRVTDELTVDAATGVPGEVVDAVAALLPTFTTDLVSARAGFNGARLFLTGRYADLEGAAAAQAVAERLGVAADLSERPAATPDQAAALQAELNEYVAANPIRFNPGSTVLDDSAIAILDHLATELRQFGGMAVVVAGHTDSDGDPGANQTLSEQRAAVVRQAIVDRGVAADSITSVGFGATRPVLVNGIEDKTASRRVEFEITTG